MRKIAFILILVFTMPIWGAWTDKYADASGGKGLEDGSSAANAWSIADALDNAVADNYVWVKHHTSAYIPGAKMDVNNSGTLATNNRIVFHGYHTAEGDASASDFTSDMDVGEAYYQSPTDAFRNGIDTNCCIDIDADDLADDLILIDNKDCIEFHHFYFHNTDKASGHDLIQCDNTPEALFFKNCRFDDAYAAIVGTNYNSILSNCLMEDSLAANLVNDALYGVISGSTFNIAAGKYGINNSCYGLTITNCFFIGGNVGIMINSARRITVVNCTFYNQTTYCIYVNYATGSLVEYNNIFAPAAQSDYAVYQDAGSILYSDYSCAYSIGNGALTHPFYDSDNSLDFIGANAIEEDPLFMDAANGDFRLKPTSPCLNTGKPTLGSGYTSMGAWQPYAANPFYNLPGAKIQKRTKNIYGR